MKAKLFPVLAVSATLLAVALPLAAHHSFAAEYDDNKPVTLTGTVTKLEWMNPHAHFYLDIKDKETGTVKNWEFEVAALNALIRRGWTRNSLKPGDVVTVEGFLAKDGSALVNAKTVTMSDGRKIFAGSAATEGGPTK
jgi:hypothetical protein